MCCNRAKSLIAMGMFLVWITTTFLFTMAPTHAESSIKLAIGIFRHGIRSPYYVPFPNNPKDDFDKLFPENADFDKLFPEGASQLTKKGKKLMQKVANIFRLRYDSLLGEAYSSKNVQFQSTAFERTMMSTEIMAQTLYPPADYQKWSENQTWHPIPVWTDYGEIDKVKLFIDINYSIKYTKMKKEAEETLNKNEIVQNIYQPLSNQTGRALSNPVDLLYIWDTLFYQDLNDLKLPQWADEFYPEPLKTINNLILKTWISYSPEILYLTTGTLFHFIKNILSEKANQTLSPDRNVFLFGGHDSTLVSLLTGIGNEEPLQTSPGATFVFELHEINHQFIIKAFYLDVINADDNFKEITLPVCGNPCTLDSFLKNVVSTSNEEWIQQS